MKRKKQKEKNNRETMRDFLYEPIISTATTNCHCHSCLVEDKILIAFSISFPHLQNTHGTMATCVYVLQVFLLTVISFSRVSVVCVALFFS